MEIKRFEGTGRMSKVVEHNGTLYLSGLTNDEGDMKEQTAAVLAKAETTVLTKTTYYQQLYT